MTFKSYTEPSSKENKIIKNAGEESWKLTCLVIFILCLIIIGSIIYQ